MSYRSALAQQVEPLALEANALALQARVREQEAIIESLRRQISDDRLVFERSSAAARIGLWECDLSSEKLIWSDVVYDIFGLPRGSRLDRQATLERYVGNSARELVSRRTAAIRDRTGFTLDAEIIAFTGQTRWIRITASVDCRDGQPFRVFGMKQDITEEKLLADRTRYLAENDVLTGLANRAKFQSTLSRVCANAESGESRALLIIDLDGFKLVNDTHGHMAGDECLREAARRLRSICGDTELVARLGGDEFGIVCSGDVDLPDLNTLSQAIIEEMQRPVFYGGQALHFGASVGIALFDRCTPSQLYKAADTALYEAKSAGRNAFRATTGLRVGSKSQV